ncbi:MAG: PAS domain-containing sensor histidine kinase [Bradyrhizobiaceae bacterium]|nr:PAS domain-containing sensor histidine kinase [Bradyrhizobiaceae bacterium]
MVLLEPIRAYVDALVHPSARSDALAVSRHRAFIAIRLLAGLIVFAAVPVHLAFLGAPALIETLVFAGLLSPLLVVAYLSRTGDFERAHLLSAGLMTAVVALVAAATGGVGSFAMPWLAVIPFEATLSTSRRVVLTTIAFAVSAALTLWGLSAAGLLPQPGHVENTFAYLAGALSAALYAGAIAVGASALARGSERVKLITDSRYHLLAQNMTDVITRHARNGAVTFISPAAERLVGVPAATLLAHGLFERVHVADRPAFLTAITDAARGHAASVAYRLRRGPLATEGEQDAAPHFIWVETRCRLLDRGRTVDGRAGEVVAVTRDITRNKEDALELERAHAEAERANEAKSRFLATVSHELRTPLNAIIGFSEMLTNEGEFRLDPARRQDYARMIRDSGQHLLAVVNSILDVSRIESGRFEINPEPLAIGPLAESCYEMMLLRAEQSGVSLDLDIVSDLPEIVADKIAVRQVLINLISNAVKFTPRGGSVRISVRVAGSGLLLSVADTGIGISETDLAQVGNPFFQAASAYDRPYEGTGLGLSVVKGLIDLHGGSFEIRSRLGEGTRVLVRLPRECTASRPEPKPDVVERLPQRAAADKNEKVKRSA